MPLVFIDVRSPFHNLSGSDAFVTLRAYKVYSAVKLREEPTGNEAMEESAHC